VGRIARAVVLGIAFSCMPMISGPQVDRDYSTSAPPNPVPPELRVDVNHATLDELLKVPGMTRSWGARILRFRPYRTKQDLLDEGVISGDVYSRIRNYLIAHKDKQ
jgi:DNA uptake protein ComE-like DNA-binding protein